MKLAISNIGYSKEDAKSVYALLSKYKFSAIEIAPGIFVGNEPYENIEKAKQEQEFLQTEYGLSIVSMQGIWFGQTGNIFNKEQAKQLINYTKKAVDFASALNIKNLVFGCPKNRVIPNGLTQDDAIEFFEIIANYANEKNTNIALEANPDIYGTNFCNTTESAIFFAKKISALKINYDFGTCIVNNENFNELAKNVNIVNHVHLSEPYLEALELTQKRKEQYTELANLLKANNYNGYVSIEMKTQDFKNIESILSFVSNVFA